ncbi:MAG: hypothetical protein ABIN24_11365 [Dyadobacter sp.]
MEFENLNLIVNKKTRAYVPYNQLNYLMMYKDKQKSVRTEWITLMPDSSWLYGGKNIYTGDILVRNWEGEYIKVYRYDKNGVIQSFKVSNPENLTGSKVSSKTTFTQCMNMRSNATCTCSDKNNCDMCEICAPYVCFTMTLISEPFDPVNGSGGASGGSTYTGSLNGGGGNAGGGNYVPTCNPNIAPGTAVGANQAMPCGTTLTPITIITPNNLAGPNYNTFEGFAGDSFYKPFFDELSDAEIKFLKEHVNLIWSGARNANEVVNYGNARFYDAQADNTNANAYKHLLWTGTNYLSWDLGNNTNYANDFAKLHELGPGSFNQHEMDRINNEVALEIAKNLSISKRNRDGMSEAAMKIMVQSDTPCVRLYGADAKGTLIKTDGSGRKPNVK